MTRRRATTLVCTALGVRGLIAAGSWHLLSDPTPSQPSTTSPQVPTVSDAPDPPYAADDDSDEAAVWRLKQEHEQWLADEGVEDPEISVSSSSPSGAMPTSTSSTLIIEDDAAPDQPPS